MGPPRLSRGTLSSAVLAWWQANHRDLPWRTTRDPWAVLVCEVMAQQTQVARVAERWAPFLKRFPTPAACAAAPTSAVLREWSGLGYNRRAVNLQRCAQATVERHGGALPPDLHALLALPGIGPYTARAVLAFAFEADAAIVDTNTARVLARWEGRRLTAREAQAAADAALVPRSAWAWNQAMLDLGATICTRRAPRCDGCPARACCSWRTSGNAEPDPADGSAGVSGGQSRFAGSDRQGRGRLIEAARQAPIRTARVAIVMGWPDDEQRAHRVAAALVREGLLVERSGRFELP